MKIILLGIPSICARKVFMRSAWGRLRTLDDCRTQKGGHFRPETSLAGSRAVGYSMELDLE